MRRIQVAVIVHLRHYGAFWRLLQWWLCLYYSCILPTLAWWAIVHESRGQRKSSTKDCLSKWRLNFLGQISRLLRCHHQLLSAAIHTCTFLAIKFKIRILLDLLNNLKVLIDHYFNALGILLTNWIFIKWYFYHNNSLVGIFFNQTQQTGLDWSNLKFKK